MIRLDRLSLRLPAFTAPHASRIAREVAESVAASVARGDVARTGTIARLSVGPVRVRDGAPPSEVAAAVSRAIVRSIAGGGER